MLLIHIVKTLSRTGENIVAYFFRFQVKCVSIYCILGYKTCKIDIIHIHQDIITGYIRTMKTVIIVPGTDYLESSLGLRQ